MRTPTEVERQTLTAYEAHMADVIPAMLNDSRNRSRLANEARRRFLNPEKVMATVRAKFKCNSITRTMGSMPTGKKNERGHAEYAPCEMWTVKMSPVYANGDPNHENSKFWSASPGGSLELTCVNAAAVACFDIEKEYYLDFTPADA